MSDADEKEEAKRALARDAEAGHGRAAFTLAELAIDANDYDAARRWGLMAAANGFVEASRMFDAADGAHPASIREPLFSRGVAHYAAGDIEDAERCWLRAAAAGSFAAMNALGILLNVQRQAKAAAKWNYLAAKGGVVEAMNNLAVFCEESNRPEDARHWYRQAADKGANEAMHNLALLETQSGNLDEAESWFRKASDAGNPMSMCDLGTLLENRGDDDGARTMYQRAIAAGYSRAGYYLARQASRLGDRAEEERWLLHAAEAGDPASMIIIAKRG